VIRLLSGGHCDVWISQTFERVCDWGATLRQGVTAMKLGTIIALAAVVLAPTAVNSQQIDVAAMTCQQFVQSDDARTNLIVAWLLGFYTDEQDPQVIDLNSLNKTRDRFINFCRQQPNFKMTTAAEGLLEK